MNINKNDPTFVFGLTLDGHGRAAEFQNGDTNYWLHIDYSVDTAEAWLGSLGLEEWLINSMIRRDTRPRTVVSDKGTLVVFRGINLNPLSDPEDMVSLRVWIEPGRIISVRQRKLLSVQDVKDELNTGNGPKTLEEVLLRLIERIGDRISMFVYDMEEQLGELETQMETDRNASTRSAISETRRKIASVRRFLAPQRDALESLYRSSVAKANTINANLLREETDRIIRYVEDLDLIRERLLVLQEDLMNLLMEQQNSRMYALSIVAVIFLPITFVSGVFGMNVNGLPGTIDAQAFTYVMLFMVATTICVIGYLLAKRWL